jgi:hypothetical protein
MADEELVRVHRKPRTLHEAFTNIGASFNSIASIILEVVDAVEPLPDLQTKFDNMLGEVTTIRADLDAMQRQIVAL